MKPKCCSNWLTRKLPPKYNFFTAVSPVSAKLAVQLELTGFSFSPAPLTARSWSDST